MANTKISALTAATTPLDGTEVLPIVQSSTTKKVANNDLRPKQIQSNATTGVLQIAGPAAGTTRTMTTPNANFTAARTDAAQSFTGDQTLGTGNLIQGTAAKGINFTANTPAAGMTSQLLNWYEEGTWTFTLYDAATGGNASATTATGYYTRVGRLVTCSVFVVSNIDTTGMTAGNVLYFSLPFGASRMGSGSVQLSQVNFGTNAYVIPVVNNASRGLFAITLNNNTTNSVTVGTLTSGASDIQYFNLTYQI